MFPNRISSLAGRHGHNPSLVVHASSTQSSTESIPYPPEFKDVKQLSIKSENRVRIMEVADLAGAVLEFGPTRRGMLKNRHKLSRLPFGQHDGVNLSTENFGLKDQKYKNCEFRLSNCQSFKKNQPQLPQNGAQNLSRAKHQTLAMQAVRKNIFDGMATQRKRTSPESAQSPQVGQNRENRQISQPKVKNAKQFELKECNMGNQQKQCTNMVKTKNMRHMARETKCVQILGDGERIVEETRESKETRKKSIVMMKGQGGHRRHTDKKIERNSMEDNDHKLPLQPSRRYPIAINPINIHHYSFSEKQEQKLQVRLGLRTKLTHLSSSTETYNLENINNQLDLGLKIIDDSFQIEGCLDLEEDNEQCMNISVLGNYGGSTGIQDGEGGKCGRVHLDIDQVEETVMDESVVSPQCMKLKEHLNSVLTSRQRCHNPSLSPTASRQNLLNSIPLLQLPNFSATNSKGSTYSQIRTDRPPASSPSKLWQSCVEERVNQLVLMGGVGLAVHRSQYWLGLDEDALEGVMGVLARIGRYGHHSNIVNVYHHILTNQGDLSESRAVLSVYKQPLLVPLIHARIYNLHQVFSVPPTHNQPLSITPSNFKALIREVISLILYCHSIQNLRLSLENLYLCVSASGEVSARMDVGEISGFAIFFQEDSQQVIKNNISIGGEIPKNLIDFVEKNSETEGLEKIFSNFMAQWQQILTHHEDQSQVQVSSYSNYSNHHDSPKNQSFHRLKVENLLFHPYLSCNVDEIGAEMASIVS